MLRDRLAATAAAVLLDPEAAERFDNLASWVQLGKDQLVARISLTTRNPDGWRNFISQPGALAVADIAFFQGAFRRTRLSTALKAIRTDNLFQIEGPDVRLPISGHLRMAGAALLRRADHPPRPASW